MSRRGKGTTKFSLFAFQDIITSVTGIMILVTLMLSIELLQRKEMSPSNRSAQIVSQMTEAVSQVDQLEAQFNSGSSMLADLTRLDSSRLRSQVQDLHELNERMQPEVTQLQQQEQQTERDKQRIESEKQRRALDPQSIDELNRKIQEKKELLEKLKRENRVIFNPAAGSSKTPWLVEITSGSLRVAQMGRSQRPQQFATVAAFKNWLGERNAGSEYFVLLIKPDGVDRFESARKALKDRSFDVGFDLLNQDQTAIDPQTGAGSGIE